MYFPDEAEWTDEVQEAGSGQRENLPEGTHELKIEEVKDSPAELVISFSHDDKRFWWVKQKFPKPSKHKNQAILLRQLAGCFGMDREEWAAADPNDLCGNRLLVEVYHKAAGDKLYVNVANFKPLPAKPAAEKPRQPAARTPLQEAKAAARANGEVPDDEIPFLWLLPFALAAVAGVMA